MANIHYEGEVNDISERQFEFIGSVLVNRGFNNTNVLVSAVGKANDNYAANVKRFAVEKDGEVFKMVAKVAPTNEYVRTKMNIKLLFLNEHVMYNYVLPKFTELEKEADIPENERLRYATCYGSLSEEPNEIIILEDLQTSDFVMLDKTKSYTDETVKLVLRNFAKLHSLSYALNKKDPVIYEDFKSKLANRWSLLLQNEELQPMFVQMEESALSILENNEHKDVVKDSTTKLPNYVTNNYRIDKDSKYAVIQQGDCWSNNMMFKFEGDKLVESCMIDYQISNENSPVADIHYMIFSSTDYETRSKYYDEWIDYYHEQLDMCLANFGLKVNVIYPRDQLDADLKRFGKYSFGMSLVLANTLLVDAHEAAKMKDAMKTENNNTEGLVDLSVEKSIKTGYKTRVNGLVNSFLELGYL